MELSSGAPRPRKSRAAAAGPRRLAQRRGGERLAQSQRHGPGAESGLCPLVAARALPFAEPFDLALALRRHLEAATAAVAVEPGGAPRCGGWARDGGHLQNPGRVRDPNNTRRGQGKVLCRGCGCFFGEGNPLRTHVQNAQSRCFNAEAAEYYQKECQEETPAPKAARRLDAGMEAAKAGDLEKLRLLIEDGWDPCTVDHNGNGPLHWAAGAGHLELCRFLAALKMDPAKPTSKHNGRTPLHWAARNGHVAVCAFLLDLCGDDMVDAETVTKDTALMLAAWQGHVELVEFLARRRADLQHLNASGCNAMHKAARMDGAQSSLQMIQYLMAARVDATTVNCNGHNALHKAAQFGASAAASCLLDAGLRSREAVAVDRDRNSPSAVALAAGFRGLAARLRHEEDLLWLTPAVYFPASTDAGPEHHPG
ncbi:unnamed protein product [Effrenium voratum]|uniref:Uncharacterized protein n=1 Tax=Effrenium voratum TaxID=2562239 RepID=A0AA36I5I6_9DINO|nr:unnamed protein product [Effrenium voratum]